MGTAHVPVLVAEVLEGLGVKPGGSYVDATTGTGGHSRAILLASAPAGQLLCIDVDPAALDEARLNLADFISRTRFANANFSELESVAVANGFHQVDGILLDLGVSSLQLGSAARGFSFLHEGPLDMRLSGQGHSAADLVNTLSETELADIIWRYGEERQSRQIARAILRNRPLYSSSELAELIVRIKGHKGRTHPATKTFQALRIAVNRELDVLDAALPQAVSLLVSGGRLAVISFHSLEDRAVKAFFRMEGSSCICPPEAPACTCNHEARLRIWNRRVIVPSDREKAENRRSRSAKLRVAERI